MSHRTVSFRVRLQIEGTVQGLGFRPFVHGLAHELGLTGYVCNTPSGVELEVEGSSPAIAEFRQRLVSDRPRFAELDRVDAVQLEPVGSVGFEIVGSRESGACRALVLPELATCPACLDELRSPDDRRFGYPFVNCTLCGPRFSIIRKLPYDRPSTTMRGFTMCPACAAEYEDPRDRRFHAQPNACPQCGPRIWLEEGHVRQATDPSAVIQGAVRALHAGRILALKGIGGFQLVVDANQERAVARLRERKHRWRKPLALMVPSLTAARRIAHIDEQASEALKSQAAPIVLLPRREDAPIAPSVAPDSPLIGLMLPYSPLHHMLLGAFGQSVVATSGNLSDEPICIDNAEAKSRLSEIADLFLLHDRPIERHVDDSVVQFCCGQLQILRRARGFAPLPLRAARPMPPVLAFGAHQKNTVALGSGHRVFVSQHIGDLTTAQALQAHERVARDLPDLYQMTPEVVAHDLHPDYASTRAAQRAAREYGATAVPVQHHHAHLVGCMLDNGLDPDTPVAGVIWDGTGHGPDGTIWGGEFLYGAARGYIRIGHLMPFRLPGGEVAAREPARSALGAVHAALGSIEGARGTAAVDGYSNAELEVLEQMLASGVRSPLTTSAGRLFDAVAALLDLGTRVSYEAEAAIRLEHLAESWQPAAPGPGAPYPVPIIAGDLSLKARLEAQLEGPVPDGRPLGILPPAPWILDWRPLLRAVLDDLRGGAARDTIANRFHRTLARAVASLLGSSGMQTVVLSGGCFQNRLLTELTVRELEGVGARVYIHHDIPPNDGGVAVGQAAIAAATAARLR